MTLLDGRDDARLCNSRERKTPGNGFHLEAGDDEQKQSVHTDSRRVSKIFGLPFHITSACFVIDPVIRCHAKINAGSFEANELSRTTSLGRGHFGHFKLMVVW